MNNSPELILPKQLAAQQKFDRVAALEVPWRLLKVAVDAAFTAVMSQEGGRNVHIVSEAIEQTMSRVGGVAPELVVALTWRTICFGNVLESLKQGLLDTQWLRAHMAHQPAPGGMQFSVEDGLFKALALARLRYAGGSVSYDLGHLRELLEKTQKKPPA